MARHESLRTTFAAVDGQRRAGRPPAGQVDAAAARPVGRCPPTSATAQLDRLLAEEPRPPFDLRRGPLLRARLVRLAADEHVLMLTLHHIVTDGWSIGVLTGDLGALYRGGPDGAATAELPALPVQYADFAAWQRDRAGAAAGEQLAYWREQLAGLAPLELPTDRPRPAGADHGRGAAREFTCPPELTDRLTRARPRPRRPPCS